MGEAFTTPRSIDGAFEYCDSVSSPQNSRLGQIDEQTYSNFHNPCAADGRCDG